MAHACELGVILAKLRIMVCKSTNDACSTAWCLWLPAQQLFLISSAGEAVEAEWTDSNEQEDRYLIRGYQRQASYQKIL